MALEINIRVILSIRSMKIIMLLSILIIILLAFIMSLDPCTGIFSLNATTPKEINKSMPLQRILWIVMILLQSILCYKLYIMMLLVVGVNKIVLRIYCTIAVCSVAIALAIFIVSLNPYRH